MLKYKDGRRFQAQQPGVASKPLKRHDHHAITLLAAGDAAAVCGRYTATVTASSEPDWYHGRLSCSVRSELQPSIIPLPCPLGRSLIHSIFTASIGPTNGGDCMRQRSFSLSYCPSSVFPVRFITTTRRVSLRSYVFDAGSSAYLFTSAFSQGVPPP